MFGHKFLKDLFELNCVCLKLYFFSGVMKLPEETVLLLNTDKLPLGTDRIRTQTLI